MISASITRDAGFVTKENFLSMANKIWETLE